MTGAKIRISLILHTGRLLFSLLLTSFVPWTFAKTSGVLLVCVDRSTCNRGEPVEMSGRVLRDPHSLFASDRTAGRKSWMADGMNGRAVRADELTVRHRRCAIYDARMTAAGIRPAVYEHRTFATPMLRRRGQCVPTLCRSGTGRHKWRPYGRALGYSASGKLRCPGFAACIGPRASGACGWAYGFGFSPSRSCSVP